MAEIKEKFYAKLGNFEPDKCNAYAVISRVDYEAIMHDWMIYSLKFRLLSY